MTETLFTPGFDPGLSTKLGFMVTVVPQAVFDEAIKDSRLKAACEDGRIVPNRPIAHA